MPPTTPDESPQAPSRKGRSAESLRIVVLFALFIGALFATRWIPASREAIFEPFTRFVAFTSHGVIRLLGETAELRDVDVLGPGVSISIREECNAVPALFVFIAAVLAYPAPIRKKLLGLAIGFPAIFAVNTVRVVTLYFAAKHLSQEVFEGLHLYVWQALVILFAIFTWIFWADRVVGRTAPVPARPLP